MKLSLIQNSAHALQSVIAKDMEAKTSFLFVALIKEVNAHIETMKEACAGKEMTEKQFNELLDTEVNIQTSIPKSQITFPISPLNLSAIECFLQDS